MQISKTTIDILNNLSNLNKSMLFLEGNHQRTIHPTSLGYAEFTSEEDFPKEFAIFDLPKFLGILSLFREPDIDFSDNSVIISEGSNKATYRFCKSDLIVHPPKDKKIVSGNVLHSFELTSENLKQLIKAVSLYGQEHITFYSKDGSVFVKTNNIKEKESEGFSYNLGNSDQNFKYNVNVASLNLMPHSYDVSITDKKKIVFKSKNTKLVYIFPVESE